MSKSRVEIKHFSIVGLMSPGWVRTQVRTHSDFCWTRGLRLGLWPTGLGLGLGLWSSGLGLGLGLWSNGLGLTPDGLGLWSYGLGLGLGLWPCGLGLTAGLTSPDSLQHWIGYSALLIEISTLRNIVFAFLFVQRINRGMSFKYGNKPSTVKQTIDKHYADTSRPNVSIAEV